MFVLLAVAAVLALLTAPLPVKARVYVTLDGFRLLVRLSVMGVVPVRAKAVLKGGRFVVTLNGKMLPRKRKKRLKAGGAAGAAKALSMLLRDGAVKGGGVALYVGGEDSAAGALFAGALAVVAGILGQSGRTDVFWNKDRRTFVLDGGVKMRISIAQTLAALVVARSEDGADGEAKGENGERERAEEI